MRYVLCLPLVLLGVGAGSDAPLRFEATRDGYRITARLPAKVASDLPAGKISQEQGEGLLTLSLLSEAKTPGPSILGKYERAGSALTFTPRFALSPGATYRATLRAPGAMATLDYITPPLAAKDPPKVIKIYPSGNVLPANHLRFYIYFDRPMRGGAELFKHLVILDEKGNEIDEPWLVDEIWDEENNCLILFIHPGRIKWGVELREQLGPVLHEKRNYTLVVRREWTDLEGNKLAKDTAKKFRTTPEDRVRIELSDWKLAAPKAGTREPVALSMPKSIDYRSLQTGLTITNDKGETIAGTIAIGPEEKHWSFTPKEVWQATPYRLNVSPELEDVAGNSPSRPFDLDLGARLPPAQKMHFDFQPK